jgi:hypothetical protein
MRNAPIFVQLLIGGLVFVYFIIAFIVYIANKKILESIFSIVIALFGLSVVLGNYFQFKRINNDLWLILFPILLIALYTVLGIKGYKSGKLNKFNRATMLLIFGLVSSILILVYIICII